MSLTSNSAVKAPEPDGSNSPPHAPDRIPYVNSGTKGAVSELRACIWLMDRGYVVFRNVSPCGLADLVAIHFPTKQTLLIEVKSASRGLHGRLHCGRLSPEARNAGVLILAVMADWIGFAKDWDGPTSDVPAPDRIWLQPGTMRRKRI